MRTLTLIAALLLFATSIASGQSDKGFALLPRTEAHRISRLCSRYRVPKVDGSWEPSKVEIDGLESRLPLISKLSATTGFVGFRIAHPTTYYRQYVGITVAKRRLIYVNAFFDDKPPSDWHEKLTDVCDGGPYFWGVLYDPETHEFSRLATNGRA